MNPIDIRPADLATVRRILREHVPALEVRVFGSRVAWNARETSDLDLALMTDEPLSLDRTARLRAALTNSDLPFRVDIVDWAAASERFRQRILADHVVLQAPAVGIAPPIKDSMAVRVEATARGNRDGWRDMTLRQLIDIGHGFAFSGRFIHEEPHGDILLTPGNVAVGGGFKGQKFKYYSGPVPSGFVLSKGDLIVTMTDLSKASDTLGYPAFIPGALHGKRYLHNQRLGKVALRNQDIDTRFLFYIMCNSDYRQEVLASATGTTVKHTSPDRILRFRLHLPPLPEQRAIAHILGTLDDKIELTRRMNATLEAMARALFRSWFVDFDPVRAKMEGRDAGLPKELADLFPDRLVNSEAGQIPEGWPLVPLPELMHVNPSRPLRKGDVAPYLDMANMPTLGHAPDSVVQRPFASGMRFANGDTLVARITPCLENGKTAYVDFLRDDEIGWGSTEYIVMKPRRPLPSEFAYLLARTTRFREFAIQNMSGTSGRQRVSASALSGFSMPLPPEAISVEFGSAAHLLLGRARAAVDERCVLANCRNALLSKLTSGEMRVGNAERFVGAIS